MDISFLYQSIKLAFGVSVLSSGFLMHYYGYRVTAGVLSGALWNSINFLLLIKLSQRIMDKTPNKIKIAFLAVGKFGVLYGIGYLMLKVAQFPIGALVIGFNLLFAVIFLRVLGKVFFKPVGV